ncbi:phosphotransferase [Celeribacter neptunius]|uniref:Phosphotransferase enzyme family protein n=1 Tax=Celeribacter neptunius TaxID=588602 RepID=A0A1I3IJS2_9RHOB|nr:phosphotransferase [Celeribacter neptunius]SFI48234.1 Phosphotransferase enzyme family protein [Celeribacter neptunius]
MARSFDTFDLIEAQRRLVALMQARPHLGARLTVRETLQTYDQRAVFDIDWDGQRAIAKLIWHDNRAPAVSQQSAALKRMAARLTPPAFVPEVLHIAPKAGLFIISYAEGETALNLMKKADRATAERVVEAARIWQEAATKERHIAPLPRARIARQIAALPTNEDPLTRWLRARLDAAPEALTHVPGHGDFWSGNLILDGDRITAIDLGPQQQMPLINDLARFARSLLQHCPEAQNTPPWSSDLLAPLLSLLETEEDRNSFPLIYGVELARWRAGLVDIHDADPMVTALLSA